MTTISAIQQHVAASFGVPLRDMTSARRPRWIARPRQVAMYLARHLTRRSLPDIGRAFGNRDHTTVMYAVGQIDALMSQDVLFGERVRETMRHLQTLPEEV